MKRAIIRGAGYACIGIIGVAAVLGSLTLLLSMPRILSWVAGYIGEVTTWGLFLAGFAGFIALCVKYDRNR